MIQDFFRSKADIPDEKTLLALEKSILSKCQALIVHESYIDRIYTHVKGSAVEEENVSITRDQVAQGLLHLLENGTDREKIMILGAMIRDIKLSDGKFLVTFKIQDQSLEISANE